MKKHELLEKQKISAIEWWNSLTFDEKEDNIIAFSELLVGGSKRTPKSLTGREITHLHKAYLQECEVVGKLFETYD